MRKTSLAEAKAKLSALVDDAEHRHRTTVILRHGRPSAAIVPIQLASPPAGRRSRLSSREIDALFAALGRGGKRGAVADLLASRR